MKYLISTLVATLTITSCSTLQTMPVAQKDILQPSDFRNNPQLIESVMVQYQNKQSIIVKVPKGEQIPLDLVVNTSLFELKTKGNTIVTKQDIYMSISQQDILLSANANLWCQAYDYSCVKKIFSLGNGDIAMALSANESGPLASIAIIESK